MDERGGELITADEAPVLTEPLLDPIAVKRRQGNRCLSNPAGPNERDWSEGEGEIDDPLDQGVASEERSW